MRLVSSSIHLLILTVCLVLSYPLHAEAGTSLKTFVFVELNQAPKEIETAKQIAQERGEEFVLLPKSSDPFRAYRQAEGLITAKLSASMSRVLKLAKAVSVEEKARLEENVMAARRKVIDQYGVDSKELEEFNQGIYNSDNYVNAFYPVPSDETAIRKQLKAQINELRLREYMRQDPKITSYEPTNGLINEPEKPRREEELLAELAKLKSQGRVVTHLTVSGHHSGDYYGDFGHLDFTTLESKTDQFDQIESMALLGCNGTTLDEVRILRRLFKNLKYLMGYNGIAPLRITPLGWVYYKLMMQNESYLTSSRDQAEFKTRVDGLIGHNLVSLPKAIYVVLEKNKVPLYYSKETGGILVKDEAPSTEDEAEKKLDCAIKEAQWPAHKVVLGDYYYGNKPIPENTSSSELRNAYTFTRQQKECLGESFPADSVGLLVFWNTVRKNFVAYHSDEMRACASELRRAPIDELIKKVASAAARYDEMLAPFHKFLQELKAARFTSSQDIAIRVAAFVKVIGEDKTIPKQLVAYDSPKPTVTKDELRILSSLDLDTWTGVYSPSWNKAFTEVSYIRSQSDLDTVIEYLELNLQADERNRTRIESEIPSRLNSIRMLPSTVPSLFDPAAIEAIDRKQLQHLLGSLDPLFTSAFLNPSDEKPWFGAVPGCAVKLKNELAYELDDMMKAPFSWHEFREFTKPETPLDDAHMRDELLSEMPENQNVTIDHTTPPIDPSAKRIEELNKMIRVLQIKWNKSGSWDDNQQADSE